ncbi:hypothetical protein [Lachnoclostridium sp.]|uniref:hypothetical protein n=1 Tax=Lachnoclostridium sp. TaxID=2028282 RepID=UPI0028A22EFA|nr:hypothetical protein [Lachnoclostridium sp.]
MNYLVNLEKCVTGFCIDNQFVYCISNESVYKIDKHTKEIIHSKKLFKKEGFSRDLVANNKLLVIRDFYTLYIMDKNNYSILSILQLGTDLSSDICGMTIDEENIYTCMRNGAINVIDIKDFTIQEIEHISSTSIWGLHSYNELLLGVNVGGELLYINKSNMELNKSILLSKQNIGSFLINKNNIYAAGQDKILYLIDIESGICKSKKRNAHKRMFDCVGIYSNYIITISYPCSEINFWNKKTLELESTINIPLKLSGRTMIENDTLHIASRNINGIISLDLKQY